jgi:hypothetical protein
MDKEIFPDADINKKDLVQIKVEDIYEGTDYLPDRMAKLIPEAWESLQKVISDVEEYGGNFRLSGAFRTNRQQMKAHLDYKMGKKNQYSPPPGTSMHEAGRAIDIDWRYESLGLKQTKVAEILRDHGWNSIVDSFGDPTKYDIKEEHHWEFRDGLNDIYKKHGYNGMVEWAIKQVGNYPNKQFMEKSFAFAVKDAQQLLDDIGIDPGPIDGVYGPKTERAVREFQKKYKCKEVNGKVDLELIINLIKAKKNSSSSNDDVRSMALESIDKIIGDLDRVKQDLKDLKGRALNI